MKLGQGAAAVSGLLTILGVGCGSSITLTEHRARLELTRTEYEALLVRHRRRAEAALAEAAKCREERAAEASRARRRVERLELSLSHRQHSSRRKPQPKAGDRFVAHIEAALAAYATLHVRETEVLVMFSAPTLFLEGAFEFTPQGEDAIEALAEALSPMPPRVTVVGYTSPRLPGESAWPLSAARARVVVERLQRAGLDPSRLVLEARAGYAAVKRGQGGVEVRVTNPCSLDERCGRRD